MELIIAKKIFQFFCHQMPERSLQFNSETFPLCFRCSGIYIGIFLSHIYAYIMKRYSKISPNRKCGLLLVLLAVPLAVDGIGDSLNFWNSPGEVRLVTGLLMGVFISLTLISIPNLFEKFNDAKSDLLFRDFIIPILLGFVSIYLFMNINSEFVFHIYTTIVLIGWSIVISHIMFFVYDSSKNRVYTLFRILLFKRD